MLTMMALDADDPSLPPADISFTLDDRGDFHAALATVFNDQRAVESILRSTTFPRGRIPAFENSSAYEVWGHILLDLELGVMVTGNYQLLTAVLRQYPANHVFRRLAQTYLDSPGSDAPESVASVLPSPDISFALNDRRDFHAALATVFDSQRAVESILRSTTFPRGRIPAFGNSSPSEVWGELLLELELGVIEAGNYQLLTAVLRPYPANHVFRRLAETYLNSPSKNTPELAAPPMAQPAAEEARCRVVVRVSAEEDRERALRVLQDLSLDPHEEWSTAHSVSYQVASDQPDVLRSQLEQVDFAWTVVAPQQSDYLLHSIFVEGPDGRRFRITDAPAQQTVGAIAAELSDQYFAGGPGEGFVVDGVGADGLTRQLDPSLTLAEAGLYDGTSLRVRGESWSGGSTASTGPVAKIILVGEGAAGKTSLITAIADSPFEESTRTHGIDIQSIVVREPESGVAVTLRFWDFGGQRVYRVTHPLFFSAHALYLVVWNARVGPEKDDVRGWIRRIVQRVGDTATVMLVATHHDEAPEAELDYAALEREFPGLLCGEYRVDNKSRNGIPALREEIARQSLRLSYSLPSRWVEAANGIFALAANRPQVSYENFSVACQAHRLSESDAEDLANVLHRQGGLVYRGDDETLNNLVILDPEWSSKAVGLILKDTTTRNNSGVLDHDRLPDLWQDRPGQYRYARHHYSYLLRQMEKFDISYRMDDGGHSLITPMVSAVRPALPWDSRAAVPIGVRRLRLICRFSSAVPWLIPALTARLSSHGTRACWRDGVFLRYPVAAYASEALIELHGQTELSIEVRAPAPDLYLHVLQDSVQYLTRQWPGLSLELRIPCPAEVVDSCPGQFRLERLLTARQLGRTIVTYSECPAEHQITALLTGFSQSSAEEAQVHALLYGIKSDLDTMQLDLRGMQAIAASSAADLRRLIVAAGTEITDCPRLFTVTTVDADGHARLKFYQLHFRLTLWCESPGHWHPCTEARYPLDKDKIWVSNAIRYARPVLAVLRVAVPAVEALVDVLPASSHLSSAKEELDHMQDLLDAFPDDFGDDQDWSVSAGDGTPVPPSGAHLREVRQMLRDVDRYERFGGLARVQAASGEYLWLCPVHQAAGQGTDAGWRPVESR